MTYRVPALALALALGWSAFALDWQKAAGYRSAFLPVPAQGRTGFAEIDPKAIGIGFTNHLPLARVMQFQNTMNGAGVACGDIDGDGWVDLYFCNKSGANALYRNLGNGTFSNITASAGAGIGCTNMLSVGAVFADINGDRNLDLLVSSFGGPHACFLGDGRGHFSDFSAAAGITNAAGSTSFALADLDGDGDLDLYWCNFGTVSPLRDGATLSERIINGQPTVTGRYAKKVRIIDGHYVEFGDPDTLYFNDGKGHFTAADWSRTFTGEDGKPMDPPWDFGLAVQIRDINGDGHPDIYVCNDFHTPDRIWLGDGKGHFREQSGLATRNMSYASMGVDFADIDRDGWLDFLTVEMLSRDHRHHLRTSSPSDPVQRIPGLELAREDFARNCLFRNRGDNTWEEIALQAGVAATDWSWTPLFLDVDLDGWEDLVVSNGHLRDVNDRDVAAKVKPKPGRDSRANREQLNAYPALEPPKFAFRNRRDLTFEEVGAAWNFNSTRIAHGMAAVDLDNDGDLDLVLNCLEGGPLIYRNESTAPRVMVRLRGRAPNTGAVGARLTLTGGPAVQTQEVLAGGQYLSSSDPARVFAAGAGAMKLEVRWRDGRRVAISGIRPNHIYEVDEETAASAEPDAPLAQAPARAANPLFQDLTERLGLVHHEEAFDDFSTQTLLPRKFSQLGPGVVVADLNGDSHADVALGTGRGGAVTVRLGNGQGAFTGEVLRSPPSPDDTAGLAVLPGPQSAALLVGQARFESPGVTNAFQQFAVREGKLVAGPALAATGSSPGTLALGDLDGDGDLDLFVGGRLVPGHYPEKAESRIFRWDQGRFVPDAAGTRAVASCNLATGALWADLDGDGFPELVVANEWGPVRIWKNRQGTLSESTAANGIEGLTGWWNSVAVGDFDGDGSPDLIAGNWGLNSIWQAWETRSPAIFYGDLEGNGSPLILEAAEQRDGRVAPWRDRDLVALGWPSVTARFPTHAQYASAAMSQILGDAAPKTKRLAAATLASTVFLNRGGKFEAHPLPREAQVAPVFGIAVADFDGDGNEDAFLAQNCFAMRPEDMRLDAGRGLMLRGDGRGGFAATPAAASGIVVAGEQRGCATGDFDEDGRPDLVVTQNGAATRLLRNVGGAPGLRVRLVGPPGNPAGLGATIRLKFGARLGPARWVSGGGGYYSQDCPMPILALPEAATGIEVSWPGGRKTSAELPANARRVAVAQDGVMSE